MISLKKLGTKIGLAALTVACSLPVVGPHIAKAAADTDFASGTLFMANTITENKSTAVNYIAVVAGAIVLIVLFLAFVYWIRRQASGVFGGKKRR